MNSEIKELIDAIPSGDKCINIPSTHLKNVLNKIVENQNNSEDKFIEGTPFRLYPAADTQPYCFKRCKIGRMVSASEFSQGEIGMIDGLEITGSALGIKAIKEIHTKNDWSENFLYNITNVVLSSDLSEMSIDYNKSIGTNYLINDNIYCSNDLIVYIPRPVNDTPRLLRITKYKGSICGHGITYDDSYIERGYHIYFAENINHNGSTNISNGYDNQDPSITIPVNPDDNYMILKSGGVCTYHIEFLYPIESELANSTIYNIDLKKQFPYGLVKEGDYCDIWTHEKSIRWFDVKPYEIGDEEKGYIIEGKKRYSAKRLEKPIIVNNDNVDYIYCNYFNNYIVDTYSNGNINIDFIPDLKDGIIDQGDIPNNVGNDKYDPSKEILALITENIPIIYSEDSDNFYTVYFKKSHENKHQVCIQRDVDKTVSTIYLNEEGFVVIGEV